MLFCKRSNYEKNLGVCCICNCCFNCNWGYFIININVLKSMFGDIFRGYIFDIIVK